MKVNNFKDSKIYQKSLSTRRGFTIIELVMVITILAIIALAFASESISNLGNNNLAAASNRLLSDLRYAQQLAIDSHESCGISFDRSDESYFVYKGDVSTVALDPYTKKPLVVDYDTDSLYAGVNLANTNFGDDISFDYLGVPYDSDGNALTSQGQIVLRVNPFRNRVRVRQGTGMTWIEYS